MHDHWLRRVFRPEQSEHARAEHFPADARPRQLRQDLHREVARRRAVERRDADHRVRQGDDQVQRIQSHALRSRREQELSWNLVGLSFY